MFDSIIIIIIVVVVVVVVFKFCVCFSHLAVVLEMKSDQVFCRYISEGFVKEKINLLTAECDDRVPAFHTGGRQEVTHLEVSAFDLL